MESSIPQTCQCIELPGLTFVTDSQDLEDLLDSIGLKTAWAKDITAALILVEDGEYSEVWLSEDNAPYENSATYHNRAYYGLKL